MNADEAVIYRAARNPHKGERNRFLLLNLLNRPALFQQSHLLPKQGELPVQFGGFENA